MKKWKPNKTAAREFAQTMNEIAEFCAKNGIIQSRRGDSYYFAIDKVNYRVSNHSINASNSAAYDELTGERVRQLYHDKEKSEDTVCIIAGKTRIREIYEALKIGKKLDYRGCAIGA